MDISDFPSEILAMVFRHLYDYKNLTTILKCMMISPRINSIISTHLLKFINVPWTTSLEKKAFLSIANCSFKVAELLFLLEKTSKSLKHLKFSKNKIEKDEMAIIEFPKLRIFSVNVETERSFNLYSIISRFQSRWLCVPESSIGLHWLINTKGWKQNWSCKVSAFVFLQLKRVRKIFLASGRFSNPNEESLKILRLANVRIAGTGKPLDTWQRHQL